MLFSIHVFIKLKVLILWFMFAPIWLHGFRQQVLDALYRARVVTVVGERQTWGLQAGCVEPQDTGRVDLAHDSSSPRVPPLKIRQTFNFSDLWFTG
jgi:hypothetical protein